MIRTLCATIAITLFMLFGSVHAAHADTKIAYIDVDRAIQASDAYQKERAKILKEHETKQAALDKEADEIKKLSAEIDKLASTAKPDVLQKKQLELVYRKQELARSIEAATKSVADDIASARRKASTRVMSAATWLTQEGKYDYCFDKGSILVGPAGDDLTAAAIKRINATK